MTTPMTTQVIKKLLVANRGEIAVRVMQTAKSMGIATVAIYSDADRDALHVRVADEAYPIGPAPASESYLVIDKILHAVKKSGATAVHPGYGFLSENPDFADRLSEEGILFLGPSSRAMNAMALKGAAKALMEANNVPVVPGYHGDDQSVDTLAAKAEHIGYPVLIKAVAGGGGKGMRRVDRAEDLPAAIAAAASEGVKSFGNAKLLIEKYLVKPRHIEVQVFGDNHGNAVYLWERDCSLQRRHQKVLEEAPAPGMSPELRREMGEAAVRAAEAITYSGAGTVEFIVDVADGLSNAPFYFMEMNTRLQVEHPVTEAITDLDLVEWQIRVAEGHEIPLSQDEIDYRVDGHAIEARLYAEDPYNGFLPQTGTLTHFNPFQELPAGCRIDTGVTAGDSVSIHYDPMIAKMVAWGETRDQAIDKLIALIGKTPVGGLVSNRDFLIALADHQAFRAGDVATDFIALHEADLLTAPAPTNTDLAIAAAVILAHRALASVSGNPWDDADGFSINLPAHELIQFKHGDTLTDLVVSDKRPYFSVTDTIGSFALEGEVIAFDGVKVVTMIAGERFEREVAIAEDSVTVFGPTSTITLERPARVYDTATDPDGPGTLIAPMPGKILKLFVQYSDKVSKGDPLLVMEAMKMEQTITAPRDGLVTDLPIREQDQVADGSTLVRITDG